MEINDGNLHVLAGYLQKTLSHDPVERRGGWLFCCCCCNYHRKFSCSNVSHIV